MTEKVNHLQQMDTYPQELWLPTAAVQTTKFQDLGLELVSTQEIGVA